jgi:hypothetical protein
METDKGNTEGTLITQVTKQREFGREKFGNARRGKKKSETTKNAAESTS